LCIISRNHPLQPNPPNFQQDQSSQKIKTPKKHALYHQHFLPLITSIIIFKKQINLKIFSESPIRDQNYIETAVPQMRPEEMMILEREFIGMENPSDVQNYDFCQELINFEDPDLPFLDQPKSYIENITKPINCQSIHPDTGQPDTGQPDTGHYQALQSRIMELEARIHDLEFEKQSVSGQNNTNSTVSNSMAQNINSTTTSTEYKIKINDFSPEWDFVEGGSKMMVCFSPNFLIPTEDQNNKLMVMFGNVEARAFCIQPGVLKCYGK